MFRFLRKRNDFDDNKQEIFIDEISMMLKVQMVVVPDDTLEDTEGNINSLALGYIYGFIDAGLRTIGQDMADAKIGIPITFNVLGKLFPGREEKYVNFLIEKTPTDKQVILGAMKGGQQYIDFNNGKLAAPMGLARYILESKSKL